MGEDPAGLRVVGGIHAKERGFGSAEDLSPSEGRKFGLTVGTAFVVLTGILWWRGHIALAWGTGAVGAALVLAGAILPARVGPFYRVWMAFAHAMSRVTTPLLMGIVYYLVLAPTGLLRRTFGRNPLCREEKNGSYWVSRGDSPRGDLERQF